MQQEFDLQIRRNFTPAHGHSAPALWIEEIRVYREFSPAGEQCRYEMRPGLNILWADPGPVDPSLYARGMSGHAAGKTTFCRLLRYLVGEPVCGTDAFQDTLIRWKPNPVLLGKVWIADEPWIVCRPLGNDPRDFALRGESIEEAFTKEDSAIEYAAFLERLASEMEKPLTATKLSHERTLTWRYMLPWLTRDQECRLAHLLEWRDATTESHRPDMTQADACYIIRSMMGLITKTEEDAVDAHRQLLADKAQTDADLPLYRRLSEEGLVEVKAWASEPTLSGALLFDNAKASLQAQIDRLRADSELRAAMKAVTDLDAELTALVEQVSSLDTTIEDKQNQLEIDRQALRTLEGEIVADKARADMEGDTPAPTGRCNVPMAVARAKGCSLARERGFHFESQKNLMEAESGDIPKAYRGAIAASEQELANITANRDDLHVKRDGKRDALKEARELRDEIASRIDQDVGAVQADINRLPKIQKNHDEAIRLANLQKTLKSDVNRSNDAQNELRQKASEKLSRVNELYEDLVQAILGDDVSASFVSQAQDIILKVEKTGDHTSSATETVKILCLDIAALLLSAEGHGHHPRFLVHDSPREADMSPGNYQRFFVYMRELEKAFGDATPNFQHIITTTEPPPEDLQKKPWLIAKLDASKAEKRLLGVNL